MKEINLPGWFYADTIQEIENCLKSYYPEIKSWNIEYNGPGLYEYYLNRFKVVKSKFNNFMDAYEDWQSEYAKFLTNHKK